MSMYLARHGFFPLVAVVLVSFVFIVQVGFVGNNSSFCTGVRFLVRHFC